MASSATRRVRWRIKVKAHVLALICPFTACCGSLWVAVGALVASAPGVQAEEGQQRYTSRTTPQSPALHVTRKTRSRRLAVAPLHHGASRCTMEHNDATGVTTPRQTVKASPHRHKWMLSRGAPAPLTHGISIVQAFHTAKTASSARRRDDADDASSIGRDSGELILSTAEFKKRRSPIATPHEQLMALI